MGVLTEFRYLSRTWQACLTLFSRFCNIFVRLLVAFNHICRLGSFSFSLSAAARALPVNIVPVIIG